MIQCDPGKPAISCSVPVKTSSQGENPIEDATEKERRVRLLPECCQAVPDKSIMPSIAHKIEKKIEIPKPFPKYKPYPLVMSK